MIDKNLIRKIKELENQIRDFMPSLSGQIDDIIETNCRDEKRIENILDTLLDFAYFNVGKDEFNRLNKYYSIFNPEYSEEYETFYTEAIKS